MASGAYSYKTVVWSKGLAEVKCAGQVLPQQGLNLHLASFISLTLLPVDASFSYVNVPT